ncbi:dimethyl sulfoxide reductase anchor subunit family protein [Roseospirillum parvum]|uniref:DMSO reductase anchor subunit n=1 Tax=Roseospirillum parvum TaxID=83401 RepID=A0A1G8A1T9_9PROT|nr:DmsC/YnfH family molybdoenzyme membrane anchor subunit [Roseospirillum parvum]SDH14945.1 DMSO reductase anchor subunit [Roseospirillum parvum]
MHPAFSVIFFTTASGAGYGLLALMGLLGAAQALPADRWLGLLGLGLALGLIGGGLMSSSAHLGRPERARFAFSQWRSSWLSREAVAAVATFVPAGLFALGWVGLGRTDGAMAAFGVLSAAGAGLTVAATAMIYASLKPIPHWHNVFTLPGYLLFGLMTGALWLSALAHPFNAAGWAVRLLPVVLVAAAWGLKAACWRHLDSRPERLTANRALGLPEGRVRVIDWPHSQANYVLKEMGYQVARQHARTLRLATHALAFALPLALSLLVLAGAAGGGAALLAALAGTLGMGLERWLFFAEARHAATLYYGAERV